MPVLSSTAISGCISVGKPGCGIVLIFSGSISPDTADPHGVVELLNGRARLFQLRGDGLQMLGDDIADQHIAAV